MDVRILVIEDDTVNMEMMLYLLKQFGYQTSMAFDGLSGLQMAITIQPDMILCDVTLPGMSGVAFIRKLRSTPSIVNIPVLAVTAMTSAGDEERLLGLGFNGYIAKPFEPEYLKDELTKLFQKFLPKFIS